jgi:hypothetical protein
MKKIFKVNIEGSTYGKGRVLSMKSKLIETLNQPLSKCLKDNHDQMGHG